MSKRNRLTKHEETNACKLFIRGLDDSTTRFTLQTFYEQWGTVVDASIIKDPTTRESLGIGSITYLSSDMVDDAQKARPHMIDGRIVEPKRALMNHVVGRDAELTVTKLFVNKMHFKHDEECLREHFGKFGNIVSMNITCKKDRRGFAFIVFDDYDAVDKIINEKTHRLKNVMLRAVKAYDRNGRQRDWQILNSMVQDDTGRYRYVGSAESGSKMKCNKVFVSKMHFKHDDECLREYFGKFGKIVSLSIQCEKDRRGVALIEFENGSPVSKILNEKSHQVKNVMLRVMKAYGDRIEDNQSKFFGHTAGNGGQHAEESSGGWNRQQFTWVGQPDDRPQNNNDNFQSFNDDRDDGWGSSSNEDEQDFSTMYPQNYDGGPQRSMSLFNSRAAPYNQGRGRNRGGSNMNMDNIRF